ncbi:MAG: ROK family protein [Verrucomicrobiota bacterium]
MSSGLGSKGAKYGLVEAGGTKVVCAVGCGEGELLERVRFETTRPEEVFGKVRAFFEGVGVALAGMGVATFGPVDVRDARSKDYGCILKTPKAGWEGASWVVALEGLSSGPVVVDTDVNGAALGEAMWGTAKGLGTVVYVTVGTGIGGGVLMEGRPVHGWMHPEVGHMLVPRERGERDGFEGVCPFHGDCLEGMASGTAIAARWGVQGQDLPDDHEAWDLEAGYLASMCANLAFTVSPERIILGGGVMQVPRVFELVRERFRGRVAGYLELPELEGYIVPPAFGQDAGLVGALALVRGG